MRRAILIGAAAVLAVASLASCESREERNAARCTSYGADANGYSDCMSRLAAADTQADSGFWHYMAVAHLYTPHVYVAPIYHPFVPHVIGSPSILAGSHTSSVVHNTTVINNHPAHTPTPPKTPNRWTFRRPPLPSSSSRPSFTSSFGRRPFGRRR